MLQPNSGTMQPMTGLNSQWEMPSWKGWKESPTCTDLGPHRRSLEVVHGEELSLVRVTDLGPHQRSLVHGEELSLVRVTDLGPHQRSLVHGEELSLVPVTSRVMDASKLCGYVTNFLLHLSESNLQLL